MTDHDDVMTLDEDDLEEDFLDEGSSEEQTIEEPSKPKSDEARRNELHLAAIKALVAGDTKRYFALTDEREDIDRRLDALKAMKEGPKSEPAEDLPDGPIGEQMAELIEALAENATKLEALGDVPRYNPTTAPPLGQSPTEASEKPREKQQLQMERARLENSLVQLRAQAPFAAMTDEEVSLAREEAEITREQHLAEAARLHAESRPRAARKAERLAREASDTMLRLFGEDERRKAKATEQSVIEQMAAKRALAGRQRALAAWKKELADREERLEQAIKSGDTQSPYLDITYVTEARNNVASLEEWVQENRPPTEREIAAVKESVANFAEATRVGPNAFEIKEW